MRRQEYVKLALRQMRRLTFAIQCELLNIQLAEERRVREGFEEQLAQNLKEVRLVDLLRFGAK
jgi:hypothetical protein